MHVVVVEQAGVIEIRRRAYVSVAFVRYIMAIVLLILLLLPPRARYITLVIFFFFFGVYVTG